MAKLTAKQEMFIQEYLIDLNATQAAIRAGYSTKTANEIGAENLTKPSIRTRIDEALAERSRRLGISQDRVVNELAKIAFVNPADVMDFDNATVSSTAKKDDTAAILSVKVKKSFSDTGETTEREVRMNDKVKSLELLGKHLGMFKDKVEISVLDKEKSKLDSVIEQMRGG
ncbi:terminase small subunit [Ruminiclostridium cellulolyticum]|uniref:Terminase small subunit n=1 Tax=Ruminiclostridium cellulolyticum (strain ATCC 35319 / DSM 5812 / JCM 6584 / H10) TaxID=394503 RepID=B8I131_RUMCH|nr:terminase small subunit [Ruminiclostridium cellulolyticum]ACL77587.1 Terminase small subunit [Ruminiclostridium cellulolyticum H10]